MAGFVTNAAAPLTAPVKKLRRLTGAFLDFFVLRFSGTPHCSGAL